jgi:hypothetical protein
MKKVLTLVLCLAMTTAVAFADEEKSKQANGDRMAKMQQNLGLNDEQVAQMRQIRDNGGSKEEFLAVLTEDQLEIMKKRRAEMKGKGRKGRRNAPKKDVQSDETTDG